MEYYSLHSKAMKLFLVFWGIMISCSTGTSKNNHGGEIIGVRLSRNFPDFDIKDSVAKIIGYDTTEIKIFKYKNQILYQIYHFAFITNGADSSEKKEYKNRVLVFSEGQQLGLFFDSARNIYNKVVSVDSFLKKQWCYRLDAKDFLNEEDSKYASTSTNIITGDTEDLYSFKGKKDSAMTGQIVFFYTDKKKLKNIEYSFSKELDSIKNKKLYKILVVTNSRFMGPPNNIYMDRSEAFYALDKLDVRNPREIHKYFDAEKKLLGNKH